MSVSVIVIMSVSVGGHRHGGGSSMLQDSTRELDESFNIGEEWFVVAMISERSWWKWWRAHDAGIQMKDKIKMLVDGMP